MHWFRWAAKRVGQLAIAVVAGTFLVVFAVTFSTFENKRGRSLLGRLWAATSESVGVYVEWWTSLISGDLGFSRSAGATVYELLLSKAPISLELIGISTALAVLIGIPAGLFATQSRFRRVAVALSSFVMAIPPMVAAPLIITWVALGLGVLPPNGWVRLSDSVGQNLEHLVLPIICLAGPFAAGVALVTIAAVESHLGSDLEMTALSKGLPRRTVLWRHILPLSLPTILADVGATFTVMIGGTVIVESIFGIGGMGPELVDASTNRDLDLLAVLVLYAILLNWIVVTLLEFLEHHLDPRITF